MVIFERQQKFEGLKGRSCFLWGPRKTGKTTLIGRSFRHALRYDLLLSDVYGALVARPQLMREQIVAAKSPVRTVIVDEVQKIPSLLDEIQWLIENYRTQFILCGSSPRKLKRSGANLLGGRALHYELFPLIHKEISGFKLLKALNHGLIPEHYLEKSAWKILKAYVGDYLQNEIAAEAVTRNVPTFARFLEAAALSNGMVVNYSSIASDCGVSVPTVKEYFQILQDTLVGRFIPAYTRRLKRRVILAPRFYFFDVGVANYLLQRKVILPRSPEFGYAFEHFIMQELFAHRHYSGIEYDISYWRTASQLEVDFVLGDAQAAVEVKASQLVRDNQLAGIKAFGADFKPKRQIVVSLERSPRRVGQALVLPWKDFLESLWNGGIVK